MGCCYYVQHADLNKKEIIMPEVDVSKNVVNGQDEEKWEFFKTVGDFQTVLNTSIDGEVKRFQQYVVLFGAMGYSPSCAVHNAMILMRVSNLTEVDELFGEKRITSQQS